MIRKVEKLGPEVSYKNVIAYYEYACECNRNHIDESNKGMERDGRNNGLETNIDGCLIEF